jgi:hypothetical protein
MRGVPRLSRQQGHVTTSRENDKNEEVGVRTSRLLASKVKRKCINGSVKGILPRGCIEYRR